MMTKWGRAGWLTLQRPDGKVAAGQIANLTISSAIDGCRIKTAEPSVIECAGTKQLGALFELT